MTDPMDMPDETPSVVITTTFPTGRTPEEIVDGHGATMSIVGSMVPPFAVITSALRAAEASMSERVREEMSQRRGPLTPPLDEAVMDSVVALNARIALIGVLTEMEHVPSSTSSFSIDE